MLAETILNQILETFFNQYQIRCKRHERLHLRLTRYFNFRLKYIGLRKRELRISDTLSRKIATDVNRHTLFDLFAKTIHGGDLNPYQSKESFNADYHDRLFNDWGIHHLHLSSSKKKPSDYFTTRTGSLVFVRFTDTIAFFIDIKHHNDQNVWSDREFIRIIQQNWPESIADKEVPDTKFNELTDQEIGVLRRKGYLFGVNVNDKSYLLLGHGQASSGDNLMAGRLADEVWRWIGANEQKLTLDVNNFINELKKQLYIL